MSTTKPKGPVFDVGLCRCCGDEKKCRLLNAEYTNSGVKEIYSDMMIETFGIMLSYMKAKTAERLICATCVSRLRDALSFRKQVLQCEEAYLQMKIYDSEIAVSDTQLPATIKVEIVKGEPPDYNAAEDDTPPDDNDDSDEDMPLQKLAASKALKPVVKKLEDTKPVINKQEIKNISVSKIGSFKKFEYQLQRMIKRPVPIKKKAKRPLPSWEQDPTYKIDNNIIALVEYSHVCPFKCRQNILLCYYCEEIVLDGDALRQHTASKHQSREFNITHHKSMIKVDITRVDCRLCALKIDSVDVFKRHLVDVHKKEYYFKAKDLLLPFKLGDSENFKCVTCDASFPYFHALNKHMNQHYSNYVCETCGQGFVDKARHTMHQQRHINKDFPCDQCGKLYKSEYNRMLHVERVHRKLGRVACPHCDVMLMTSLQRVKHLEAVHGIRMEYPCDECNKIFLARPALLLHLRRDHEKDNKYICQFCGRKFFLKSSLNHHLPTHTGDRNFKCEICDKNYMRLKTLRAHQRIHHHQQTNHHHQKTQDDQ